MTSGRLTAPCTALQGPGLREVPALMGQRKCAAQEPYSHDAGPHGQSNASLPYPNRTRSIGYSEKRNHRAWRRRLV